MRTPVLTLAGLLLLAGPLAAQQPSPAQAAPAPVLDPANNRLDAHLVQWEREMKNVATLGVQCTRTTLDKAFGATDVFEGGARYMKPDLAALEMVKKDKPGVFEKWVCSGTYLYEYAPQQKVIRVHELPPNKNGQGPADDSVLSFLFGLKAEDAKKRYDMTLVKEDQWYVYLKVFPRFAADKADFQEARLVLNNKTYLPRQLWFIQPNGNEITWDIPKVDVNPRLNRDEFTKPATPPGWSLVRMPKAEAPRNDPPRNNTPPRVIRQNKQ